MSTRGDEKSAGVTSGTPIKSLAEKSHSAPTIVGESMNIRKIPFAPHERFLGLLARDSSRETPRETPCKRLLARDSL